MRGRPPAPSDAGGPKPAAAEAKPPAPEAKPAAVASKSGKASTVQVTVKTYAVVPDTARIPAGEVTFSVKNAATDLEHEMVIVKIDLAPTRCRITRPPSRSTRTRSTTWARWPS